MAGELVQNKENMTGKRPPIPLTNEIWQAFANIEIDGDEDD